MRLVDLNPAFLGAGGSGVTDADGRPAPERSGVGLAYDCPCGCARRGYVAFQNPLDGGAPTQDPKHVWSRVGDSFDTLQLSPSIQHAGPDPCRWHGYIGKDIPGEVTTC